MLRSRLFRTAFAVSTGVVLLFVVLGFVASQVAHRLTQPETMLGPRAPTFFARLVDRFDARDRARALGLVEQMMRDSLPFKFMLVDGDGRVLAPAGAELPFDWASAPKPSADYDFVQVGPAAERRVPSLIRFAGAPAQYLYVRFEDRRGPPPPRFGGVPLALSSLVFSLLLGIGLSAFLLTRSLEARMRLADSVMSELQRGNLKARLPVKGVDEIGQVMGRFNLMADEIERLVERLESAERSRMALLQELAHDLRTPIASLRNLVETVDSGGAARPGGREVSPELRTELLGLARREVDYFERLVEDLLVLAQVSEPRYHAGRDPIRLDELLADEIDGVAASYASEGKVVEVSRDLAELEIPGNPSLVRRMIRNTLDNAFSFSRGKVRVALGRAAGDAIEIVVEDDGQGFSPDALGSYGERRVTRELGTSRQGRLSVGLGSVIIRTIARLHRGDAVAVNRHDDEGRVVGSRVVLTIAA